MTPPFLTPPFLTPPFPNDFLLVSNIAQAVLGEQRELSGVDFEFAGGDGRLAVFISSVDDGTGDSIMKTD